MVITEISYKGAHGCTVRSFFPKVLQALSVKRLLEQANPGLEIALDAVVVPEKKK